MDSLRFSCFQTVGLILLGHEVLRTRKEERIRSWANWSEQDMATRTFQCLQDTEVYPGIIFVSAGLDCFFVWERQPAVTPCHIPGISHSSTSCWEFQVLLL